MHDVFLFIPIAGFLQHHNYTCSESTGFRDEPNSRLLLEGAVLPPTPSSLSLPLQTLNSVGEMQQGTLERSPD